MNFRKNLKESDYRAIEEILNSTGFFYDYEVEVALELVRESLDKGQEASGYFFIIAEKEGRVKGYACYGKTPCTADSYDLYWMAVHQDSKGEGTGKALMNLVEKDIAAMNGRNIWIETSSRPLYEPTRMFYLKTGCEKISELPDFYSKGDHKVIFRKMV